jgi:hypothetical protein
MNGQISLADQILQNFLKSIFDAKEKCGEARKDVFLSSVWELVIFSVFLMKLFVCGILKNHLVSVCPHFQSCHRIRNKIVEILSAVSTQRLKSSRNGVGSELLYA